MKRNIKLQEEHRLVALFEQNNWMIENKKRLTFEFHLTETIMGVHHLKTDKKKKYTLDLLAGKDMNTFITANQLQALGDINTISKSELWLRYLLGNGYVCCEIEPLELELCFRIVKDITIVYRLGIHYYDEIYKALWMTEQFEEYVNNNWQRLHLLSEMRWKNGHLEISRPSV
jgi:hypothetical protein